MRFSFYGDVLGLRGRCTCPSATTPSLRRQPHAERVRPGGDGTRAPHESQRDRAARGRRARGARGARAARCELRGRHPRHGRRATWRSSPTPEGNALIASPPLRSARSELGESAAGFGPDTALAGARAPVRDLFSDPGVAAALWPGRLAGHEHRSLRARDARGGHRPLAGAVVWTVGLFRDRRPAYSSGAGGCAARRSRAPNAWRCSTRCAATRGAAATQPNRRLAVEHARRSGSPRSWGHRHHATARPGACWKRPALLRGA